MLRIPVGASKENQTTITLSKSISDSSIIVSDPFGANRMRYQYPQPFDMETKGKTLNIKKNDKISPTCTSFFPQNGWTLPLTVSILPNDQIWESNETIQEILPTDYGRVKISNTIKSKYTYGILIPTFGRYEYVRTCLESLKKTELPDVLIVIVDESLTKDVDNIKLQTQQYIETYENNLADTIKIYKNKHGNMFDSLLIGLDLICARCEYLMNLDSDTIHTANWLQTVSSLYNELVKQHELVLVTGYNSNNHAIKEQKPHYVIKESVGGCHLFFSSKDYIQYLRYTIISNKWDTNIFHQVHSLGGIIASTVPSVIEHIGEESSVRNEKNTDKSLDFALRCVDN